LSGELRSDERFGGGSDSRIFLEFNPLFFSSPE
jgi:hypothetical protein